MNPLKYKSNYDKYPVVQLPDDYIKDCFPGWNAILSEIASKLQQKVGKKKYPCHRMLSWGGI